MYQDWKTNFNAGKQDYVFGIRMTKSLLKKYDGDRDIYLYPDRDLILDDFNWSAFQNDGTFALL